MTRVAVFDCFSGISGDMALGALIDAGAPLAEIERALLPLDLPKFELRAGRVGRGGIEATRLEVLVAKEMRYSPEEMVGRIASGGFPERAGLRARHAIEALARGEATVHGTEKPHFHEVGGVDALIDIAGTALALELLGIDRAWCPVVTVGSGTVVRSEHGMLPAAPAPAASAILRGAGFRLRFVDATHELVTPTGAAILAAMTEPGTPTLLATGEGYGAGKRDSEHRPNALRIFIGQPAGGDGSPGQRRIALLEANIDDMSPELLAHARDRLLAEGALDAWLEPIGMKKGRAASKLCALVPEGDEAGFAGVFFAETTTLGVRTAPYSRFEAERAIETVTTSFGPLRVKVSRRGDGVRRKPEFDDVRRLAEELGRPVVDVWRAVNWEIGNGEQP